MLGDDTTDEDAFAAAQALGGLAVKVGPGPTAARLRAPDPAAVRAWLAREAGRPLARRRLRSFSWCSPMRASREAPGGTGAGLRRCAAHADRGRR